MHTRIFFGCCNAVSYMMMDILLKDRTLDDYPKQPSYYINKAIKIPSTFTKEKFLESIKNNQGLSDTKKLEKIRK